MIQQSPTERADEVRVNPVRIGDEVHLFIAGLGHTVGLTRAEAVQLARLLDTTSQAAQPAEADGWGMVPREPTEVMLRAPWHGVSKNVRAQIWSAMLAATPKAPATDANPYPDIMQWKGQEATPPAPNDGLRAALEESEPAPNVSLCTWEVAGPWWKRRARKLERAVEAALKENRRG